MYVFDATTSAYVGAATMGPGAAYSDRPRRPAATRPTSRPTRPGLARPVVRRLEHRDRHRRSRSAPTPPRTSLLASPPTFTLSGTVTTSGGPLSGTFVYVFDATTSAYVGAATMGPGAAYSDRPRRPATTRPTSRPTRRPTRPVVRRLEHRDRHHHHGQRQHQPGPRPGQPTDVHPGGRRDDAAAARSAGRSCTSLTRPPRPTSGRPRWAPARPTAIDLAGRHLQGLRPDQHAGLPRPVARRLEHRDRDHDHGQAPTPPRTSSWPAHRPVACAAGGRWTATRPTARAWPTTPASSAARPSWPGRSVRRCRSTAARTRPCRTPTAWT